MLNFGEQMPVEAFASAASAWMTNGRTGKNKRKCRKRNADRRNVICRGVGHGRASQRGGAHLSAFHRGSCPKESFIARDSASGQASWDVADSDLSFERALPAPACPSPASSSRPGPSAEGLMPKAARWQASSGAIRTKQQ